MAATSEHSKSQSNSVRSISPSEATPLLQKQNTTTTKSKPRRWPKSVVYRVLIAAFMVSLSFGVTQVPLIYVFGVMTCDEYYKHHKLPPLGTPAYDARCSIHSIEASTARAVALVGSGTTLFGVANLFVTGWTIKVWGIKRALLITIFWPAVRLLIQNIGVMTGAGMGILIIQLSQIITIVGGPAGYLLALNSFATEVVRPVERTATIGRLTGCAMFGTALGYLAGGLLSDWFSIIAPFRVTLMLFCISTAYAAVFLPYIPLSEETQSKTSKSLAAFFEPMKMFTPRKWVLPNGTIRREYGVLLLGAGAFLAVFATGYIPVLLQMYSTDVFGFSASDNSKLISLNFVIRATFLTFAFPAIIDAGRKWLDKPDSSQPSLRDRKAELGDEDEDAFPTDPDRLAPVALPAGEANANEPDEPLRRMSTSQSGKTEVNESFAFDLLYTRWSLILDGVLTAGATFTTKGWQMYIVAIVIPFAAGTGSAAKGTMLQMCTPEQKTDALSAISLLEMVARLSTVSLFGLIFSGFAEIGRQNLTFAVNGGMAVVGFVVLLFARFPPEGAVRYTKQDDQDDEGD
jgi:MFS family permease